MGGGAVLGKRQMLSTFSSMQMAFFVDLDDVDEMNDSGHEWLLQQSPSDDVIPCSGCMGISIMQYVGVGVTGELKMQQGVQGISFGLQQHP